MRTLELTKNTRALIATLFFRMLFGGYLVAMDQYRYDDAGSAWTVLAIYVLMGVFASIYLYGKRLGLKGLIGLEIIFLLLNTVFIVIALGGLADVGMHSPLDNLVETLLRYTFSLLTLLFSIRAYREEVSS